MMVLGLDVDTHFIGVALVMDGLPYASCTVKLKGRSFEDRLRSLVDIMETSHARAFLPGGITTWPDLIAVEDRNVPRNQRTTNRLGEMVGAIKALFVSGSYAGPFMDVNSSRKLAVIGLTTRCGRETLKTMTVHYVGLMCQAQGVPAPDSDHAADAYLVARAAYLDAKVGGTQDAG
jgi:Holliday junction resolvasome RuvABC endonuclease subunit